MFPEMRRKKQQLSDEECKKILKNEKRAVLAVNGNDGYPYAFPINFYYDETDNVIYFHCGRKGHKIDAMNRDNKVCFTVHDAGYQKDDWSYYVNSVIIFGKAELVTDEAVFAEKLKTFGLKYYPTEESVDKEIARDSKGVLFWKINIEHMTGKLVHEK